MLVPTKNWNFLQILGFLHIGTYINRIKLVFWVFYRLVNMSYIKTSQITNWCHAKKARNRQLYTRAILIDWRHLNSLVNLEFSTIKLWVLEATQMSLALLNWPYFSSYIHSFIVFVWIGLKGSAKLTRKPDFLHSIAINTL